MRSIACAGGAPGWASTVSSAAPVGVVNSPVSPSLGAERVDWDLYPANPDFVVLADPDDNRFCVVDLSHTW